MMTRRTFLKRTAQAGIAAAIMPEAITLRDRRDHALSVTPQPLRIPAAITGGDLNLAPGTLQVYPDAVTNLLMVNNSFPSPTIKVKKGDTFSATIHNNLTEETVLHWHGVHAPAAMSGHPIDAVQPGTSYSVNFPIIQRSSINFYHAHPHMLTSEQVYMGLAGFFLIEDDEELALGLPAGMFDIPLMIQDKRVDDNRQLVYDPTSADIMSAWLGDTILVNGTPNPFLAISPTLYRFRIVNASNGRFYKLGLSDAHSFTVIGNDGGFLDAPVTLNSANLAPAERLDVLIDFSSYSQGQSVTLQSLPFTFTDPPGSGTVSQGAQMDLMLFQVSNSGVSNGVIPTTLPSIVPYALGDAKRTRVWSFAALHHINDLPYDMTRIDAHVPFGELEEWSFQSEGSNTHPVHVHGAQFQVVDRNGSPPDPWERGWKDVIRLDPLGEVNVLVNFNDYDGLFVIHCHKLEHADAGMMANFSVDRTDAVKEDVLAPSTLQILPNPAVDHTLLQFPRLSNSETLTVGDSKGAVMLRKTISAGSDHFSLSTSKLPVGKYLISIGTYTGELLVLTSR